MKMRLFTPGPTPVPEEVMLRMAAPIPHHRHPEFREVMRRVNRGLRNLFRTSSPVITMASSGTGAMEAVVVNLFSPGEMVITVNGGKFGERWGEIAKAYGVRTVEIRVSWGEAVQPDQIQEALLANPECKGVLLTHCETSTGTAVDVRDIARTVRESSGALIVVDGISAIGALEFEMDLWGIDACISASQKGLMVPPGLAFAALGPRAVEVIERSTSPRFYFDLRKALKVYGADDTPWTPAISLIIGVDAALEMIEKEGIENVWRRHRRLAVALRGGLKEMGFPLFSHSPSDALTAAWLPQGVDWKVFNGSLKSSGFTVAGGQGDFVGKIFRVAHLGYCDESDILAIAGGLEEALQRSGVAGVPGRGVREVERLLQQGAEMR